MRANNLKKYTQNKIAKESKVPSGVLPQEILQEIENVEMPKSLLSKEEPQQEKESLLSKGEE